MVTCRHILDSVANLGNTSEARHPTIALQIDKIVLNLSYFDRKGIKLGVQAPEPEMRSPEVDIVLGCIDGSYWHLLSDKKNKVAIDLDSWREPNWNDVTYCRAVGYQNEDKKIIPSDGASMVAAPLLNVVAELSSIVRSDTTVFSMSSKLSCSHNYSFSGMSGGAVYAIEGSEKREVQDEKLFPVGIVSEGFPSTKQAIDRNNEEATSAFLTQRDILIRVITLTPDIFDVWLEKSGDTLPVLLPLTVQENSHGHVMKKSLGSNWS